MGLQRDTDHDDDHDDDDDDDDDHHDTDPDPDPDADADADHVSDSYTASKLSLSLVQAMCFFVFFHVPGISFQADQSCWSKGRWGQGACCRGKEVKSESELFLNVLVWGMLPQSPSNSYHQDYHIFSRWSI